MNNKVSLGILLIIMMLGHNFVLNQAQTLQTPLENIHNIGVTEFNLLYSIPSAISIPFVIVTGMYYQKLTSYLLWIAAITLSLGQLIAALTGGNSSNYGYPLLLVGRILEGIGSQVQYLIQGHMASSWMGKYAGVVFMLPQVGEIANVFITPIMYMKMGVGFSFLIGFVVCLVSSTACILIYFYLKKHKSIPITSEPEKNFSQQRLGNFFSTPNIKSALSVNNITVNGSICTVGCTVQQMKQRKQSISDRQRQTEQLPQPKSIWQAGKIFWLLIVLCSLCQSLYFPFLDDANELITSRFCIAYEQTGYYLSVPFFSAMITSALCSCIIPHIQRHKLILIISFIPLIGHILIFFNPNCNSQPTILGNVILIVGMIFFGIGIGTYYSVSWSAIGLSVPTEIRGVAYACMAFFQAISITIIPIISGVIVQMYQNTNSLAQGYKKASILFISLSFITVIVSFFICAIGQQSHFGYNDEDQLQNEENKEDNKDTSKPRDTIRTKETSSAIQVQKTSDKPSVINQT